MGEIIHQKFIFEKSDNVWHESFSNNEYLYLKHVLNGMLKSNSGFDEVSITFDETSKTLHIYEPFSTLNYLGYGSPSVVSIKFIEDKIQFFSGDDNGIGINSKRLKPSKLYDFPSNLTSDICFWHFIDAIGSAYEELYD